MRTRLGLTLVFLFALAAPISAQTTIDTGLPAATGSYYGRAIGRPLSTAPWYFSGETFTAPSAGTIFLTSLSFGLLGSNPGSFPASLWVQGWNGTTTTGSILYAGGAASSIGTTPLGIGTSWFTWDIGGSGLALMGGSQYVAFLGTSLGTNDFIHAALIDVGGDTYSGGGTVQTSMATNSLPTTWLGAGTYASTDDASFRAEFTPTPEPSTFILLATGLFGLGMLTRRRRQREA